jgi:ubiquinone/menaquinone biosynthesis C-methylase UbiE
MTRKSVGNKENQLETIRRAYDRTVDNFFNGITDEDLLPMEFKTSERYLRFHEILKSGSPGSADPKIKEYLDPKPGMRFLDVGSAANLIVRDLGKWPSTYYGIDISPKLVDASREFAKRNNIKIGGLYVADAAKIPFEDGYFDICAVIGVLEYYDIPYIRRALEEISRVLKPRAKIVVDMPNLDHPEIMTMVEFEGYLGRPRHHLPTSSEFEAELKRSFFIDEMDRSQIMTGYFAKAGR